MNDRIDANGMIPTIIELFSGTYVYPAMRGSTSCQ